MKTLTTTFFVYFFINSFLSYSQDGVLDSSFGDDGIVITDFYGETDGIRSVVQLSTDKIMALGSFSNQSVKYQTLSKYLLNGDVDESFGDNGNFIIDYGNPFAFYKSIAAQEDDKIIVSTTSDINDGDFLIARHLSNGNLDNSFGNNGIVQTDIGEDLFYKSKLQNDGKITLFGSSRINNNYNISLIRYLTNGNLDTSFGNNGVSIVDLEVDVFNILSVVIQENGLINVIITTNYAPKTLLMLQYTENGVLDNSFGNNGTLTIATSIDFAGGALQIKNDGKFLVSYTNPMLAQYKLIQYLPNGTVDASFGNNGEVNMNIDGFAANKIFIQQDEKILIYGRILEYEGTMFCLTRYNSNGALDTTFGDLGITTLGLESSDVIIQNDGKILGVGNTYWYNGNGNFMLVRYHNNGTLGTTDFTENKFSAYPNPSQGKFYITHGFISTETPYQISDITGKLIQQGNLSGEQTQFNLSQFQNGIYLFTSEGSTVRLIKN